MLLQGGSSCVLTYKDVTGSTPAQLALEKGHRYLGMHLAEYKEKHESSGWLSKHGRLAWLTSTQLCPVIWLLVLGLLAIFAYKVRCCAARRGHYVCGLARWAPAAQPRGGPRAGGCSPRGPVGCVPHARTRRS